MFRRIGVPSLVVGLLCTILAACTPAGTPRQPSTGAEPGAQSSAPKRIVTAIMVEPVVLYRPLIPGSLVIQTADLGDAVLHVGLTFDQGGRMVPRMAEAVPSLENGQGFLFSAMAAHCRAASRHSS